MSLVTFGVISLSIYPSGIFRKDKFAESFVAHGCKRDETSLGSLDPERESSEVRHGFLHRAGSPLPGAHGVLCVGLSRHVAASGAAAVLGFCLSPWSRWNRGRAVGGVRRTVRLTSQNKGFGLTAVYTTYELCDRGQGTESA